MIIKVKTWYGRTLMVFENKEVSLYEALLAASIPKYGSDGNKVKVRRGKVYAYTCIVTYSHLNYYLLHLTSNGWTVLK